MFEPLQILKTLNTGFNEFLEEGDSRVKEWPLMKNPFASWVMIAAYVYFVKVAGPRWMMKREPFNLRSLMILYNFSMVIANMYVFFLLGWYGYFDGYCLCQPVDYSNDHKSMMVARAGWIFYILKFVEFADTIFFVLRKKYRQISVLHVVHHSLVPFSLWFGVKFAPGGYNAFFPFLNSFVHVLMYTYYGLAALGPEFQKYLVWKKYMTIIQLGQFVFVLLYAAALFFKGCDISRTFILMNFLHALLFLVLFFNFFVNSYKNKGQGKCQQQSPTLKGTKAVVDKSEFLFNAVHRRVTTIKEDCKEESDEVYSNGNSKKVGISNGFARTFHQLGVQSSNMKVNLGVCQ